MCQSLFFNKLLSKRDSGTGIFLWLLRNFLEHLFYRTRPVAASRKYESDGCPVLRACRLLQGIFQEPSWLEAKINEVKI